MTFKHEQAVVNHHEGLGALLGYGTGLGIGVAYALIRGKASFPEWATGLLFGAATMITSGTPSSYPDSTKPLTTDTRGWLPAITPQLAYGVVTSAALTALDHSTQRHGRTRLHP